MSFQRTTERPVTERSNRAFTLIDRAQVAWSGVLHKNLFMLDFWTSDSANEADFAKDRHRTLPIPASISPVPNYPSKLRIYKTNASPFWQVRSFFKGKTYRQSTRTTNKAVAFRAAKEFFHLKVAEIFGSGVPVHEDRPVVFRDLVDPTLSIEQARNERGEFSTEGLRILQNRLYKKVVPFFGDMAITDVGYTQVSDFVNLLSREGSSTTTIQQYLIAIRKVVSHAYANNLITNVPKFPSVKISVTPRGSFTLMEYRDLVRAARRNVGTKIPVLTSVRKKQNGDGFADRNAYVSIDLEFLIVFMVNSFVRPSDIKNLQHQHVTVVRGEYTYLRLNLPESKLHDKPIVTMIPAVRAYERLSAINALRGYAWTRALLVSPFLTLLNIRSLAMTTCEVKYEPKHINDVVFNNSENERRMKLIFLGFKTRHLFLSGQNGTGKTLLTDLLVRHYTSHCPSLLITDPIEKVMEESDLYCYFQNALHFAKLAGAADGDRIVIVFHELDTYKKSLSKLWTAMDRLKDELLVIITTNKPMEFENAVRSRCAKYNFTTITPEDFLARAQFILTQEQVELSDADVLYYLKTMNILKGNVRDYLAVLDDLIFSTQHNLPLPPVPAPQPPSVPVLTVIQ